MGGSFTVKGTLDGHRVIATWDDGVLSNDFELELAVERLILGGKPLWATLTGPRVAPALTPDYVALLTIASVMEVLEVEGEASDWPDDGLPPGTVY